MKKVLADFESRGSSSEHPVHVINMNVVDNPEVGNIDEGYCELVLYDAGIFLRSGLISFSIFLYSNLISVKYSHLSPQFLGLRFFSPNILKFPFTNGIQALHRWMIKKKVKIQENFEKKIFNDVKEELTK